MININVGLVCIYYYYNENLSAINNKFNLHYITDLVLKEMLKNKITYNFQKIKAEKFTFQYLFFLLLLVKSNKKYA